MKLYQIYKMALSQAKQDEEDEDVLKQVPNWLNVILQECLDTENMLRRYDGAEPLQSAPYIETLTENDTQELTYHDSLLRTAVVYALAAQMLLNDEENALYQDARAKYVSALSELTRAGVESVVDVYA